MNKLKIGDNLGFGKGDTVGCGINFFKNEVFFTKNGTLFGDQTIRLEKISELFATVSLGGKGDSV